jgi:SAM domain (Sterile alpha motif)/Adenylate and Guanylate cyclase catalytic domain
MVISYEKPSISSHNLNRRQVDPPKAVTWVPNGWADGTVHFRVFVGYLCHRKDRGRVLAMQQIAEWLDTLGLSEYAQRFADNDIDTSVLRHLTDQDLKELGVSLGHRRKMFAAIAKMGNSFAAPAPVPSNAATALARNAPAAVTSQPSISATAQVAGERRYLTVMFCDLVGSTSISAQLDAEEWRDLVGSYLDAASEAVTEMGGHVAKKLGDGLMALFGYPVAQENDAERAARAALSIQRALADVNQKNADAGKPALNARIGR